jgi:SHS2 domain-containing protein
MFEILEHTADIGFRVRAGSLPQLFESAAEALVTIAMETENISPRGVYALAAEADGIEPLLVNWLSEVLYRVDGDRLALRDFSVKELTPDRIVGEASGEPIDPARHCGKLVIKGVTYHQLKVVQDNQGWLCEVFLDV